MLASARQMVVRVQNILPHKSKDFSRRHTRHSCSIAATMNFSERGFSFDGELNEISLGGARFRPVHNYILERAGDPVVLRFGEEVLEGHIVNTTPQGYGLRLREPIQPDQMDRILAIPHIEI